MTITKTIFVSAAIIFLLCSCSFGKKSELETQSEIYSRVMAHGFSYSGSMDVNYCKDGMLTISSSTEDFRTVTANWETAKDYFPQLEQETWESFLQVNAQQIAFPTDLDLGCPYILLDIKQNPPNPPIENCSVVNFFSQIGLNSGKDHALVSYVQSCGWYSCGTLYFAELIDRHWDIKDFDEIVCA